MTASASLEQDEVESIDGSGDGRRKEWLCFAAILGVVLLANAMPLLGIVDAVPYDNRVGLVTQQEAPWLRGGYTIDPNDGFTAEALGRAAANSWVDGQVPYWNHFEGLGAPLAGEMQSGAFSPLVLLLLLRNGLLYMHVLLEIVAGIATFLFVRRLGLSRVPALVAGVLFALNGTHAWLTNAVFAPVAFLPVILLGVEQAFDRAKVSRRGGLATLSVGLALSLLAGFPEVAFINGLLVALWCVVRAFDLDRQGLMAFARKLAGALALGVALAAPVITAFLAYLDEANVGGHSGALAEFHLRSAYMFAMAFPYAAGSIFGSWATESQAFWGSVGGYLGATPFVVAVLSLGSKEWRRAKLFLVAFWMAIFLRIFGISHWTIAAWNLIPGIDQTAFYRYSVPALSFATVLLVAFGLEGLRRDARSTLVFLAHAAVPACILVALIVQARKAVRLLTDVPLRHPIAIVSVAAVALLVVVLLGFASPSNRRHRAAVGVGLVLVTESLALFVVPQLSAPRNVRMDLTAVQFLRDHLGTQRFFSIGPITPNYGSYLGLAQLNVNDIPTPSRWDRFAERDLNPNSNPQLLTGFSPLDPNGPDGFAAFAANTPSYVDAGVKYLVLGKGMRERVSSAALPMSLAFENEIVDIYELTKPALYFSAPGCDLQFESRTRVTANCTTASVMRRTELAMAGWSATVNGRSARVGIQNDRYQTVELPQGMSVISFEFAPPHARISWLAAAAAAIILVAGGWRTRRVNRRVAPIEAG
jgi:Bacterial membrane protein YfhO